MKRLLLLLLIFFSVFMIELYAQEKNDSLSVLDYQISDEFEIFKGKPIISLHYGISQLHSKNINAPLAAPGKIEFKLGYASYNQSKYADNIVHYKDQGINIVHFSNSLIGKEKKSGELQTGIWQFGITRESGYGYKIGESSNILPYSSGSFIWTRFDIKDTPILPSDAEYLDLYHGTFRFGTKSEGGVKIQIIPLLNIVAGYEYAAIFSRHLFWKQLGNMIIETAGQAAINGFVKEIFKSSPAAGPIVEFLLKNGWSFAMYELRKDKMSWPFDSAAPITYDAFKIGLQFRF